MTNYAQGMNLSTYNMTLFYDSRMKFGGDERKNQKTYRPTDSRDPHTSGMESIRPGKGGWQGSPSH